MIVPHPYHMLMRPLRRAAETLNRADEALASGKTAFESQATVNMVLAAGVVLALLIAVVAIRSRP